VAIGLAPVLIWPAIERAMNAWSPAPSGSGAPAPLAELGFVHVALAIVAAAAAWWLWRRAHRHGLTRAPTWDCGYAAPTARMQYTAGSFAAIITEWFQFILRPRRHDHRPQDPFPAAASFTEHTPETVLEHVVEPAGGLVMRLSRMVRRLQHGRAQAYVFYLLIGIAALALVVLL
jgi:hydrogenase-4 component B